MKSTDSRDKSSRSSSIDKRHKKMSKSHSRSTSPKRKSKVGKIDHDACSIYLGNVDYSANEDDIREAFIKCGHIVRVTIIKNMRTGHSKGAAFVEFDDEKAAQKALKLNGEPVRGRPLIVTEKKPRPEIYESRERSRSRSRGRDGYYSSHHRAPPPPPPPPPHLYGRHYGMRPPTYDHRVSSRYDTYYGRRGPPPPPPTHDYYDPYNGRQHHHNHHAPPPGPMYDSRSRSHQRHPPPPSRYTPYGSASYSRR